jgi:hypothetical protein
MEQWRLALCIKERHLLLDDYDININLPTEQTASS